MPQRLRPLAEAPASPQAAGRVPVYDTTNFTFGENPYHLFLRCHFAM
jgi:hypothetical protein